MLGAANEESSCVVCCFTAPGRKVVHPTRKDAHPVYVQKTLSSVLDSDFLASLEEETGKR